MPSSAPNAIDHLRRAERPKAIGEIARVLKPGGEFLLMIVQVDWKTWLVSPLLAHHPSQDPEPWRAWLQEKGFRLEEEGTQFSTLYFLAKKQDVTRMKIPGIKAHEPLFVVAVRRSMTIGMPNRGRSVMSAHGSTLCCGTR